MIPGGMLTRGLRGGGRPIGGPIRPVAGPARPIGPIEPAVRPFPVRGTGPVGPQAPGEGEGGSMMRRGFLGSFKKGGKVKKTGLYLMHKGEKVVPVKDLGKAKR